MLDPLETFDDTAPEPILTDVTHKDLTDYKMMLNMSKENSFVIGPTVDSHHFGHYPQHIPVESMHQAEATLVSSPLVHTPQMEPNNGYSCSFF